MEGTISSESAPITYSSLLDLARRYSGEHLIDNALYSAADRAALRDLVLHLATLEENVQGLKGEVSLEKEKEFQELLDFGRRLRDSDFGLAVETIAAAMLAIDRWLQKRRNLTLADLKEELAEFEIAKGGQPSDDIQEVLASKQADIEDLKYQLEEYGFTDVFTEEWEFANQALNFLQIASEPQEGAEYLEHLDLAEKILMGNHQLSQLEQSTLYTLHSQRDWIEEDRASATGVLKEELSKLIEALDRTAQAPFLESYKAFEQMREALSLAFSDQESEEIPLYWKNLMPRVGGIEEKLEAQGSERGVYHLFDSQLDRLAVYCLAKYAQEVKELCLFFESHELFVDGFSLQDVQSLLRVVKILEPLQEQMVLPHYAPAPKGIPLVLQMEHVQAAEEFVVSSRDQVSISGLVDLQHTATLQYSHWLLAQHRLQEGNFAAAVAQAILGYDSWHLDLEGPIFQALQEAMGNPSPGSGGCICPGIGLGHVKGQRVHFVCGKLDGVKFTSARF